MSADGALAFALKLEDEVIRRLARRNAPPCQQGTFTDSSAFHTAPPATWSCREGGALSGKLLRVKEVSPLRLTADLMQRFVTGAAILIRAAN